MEETVPVLVFEGDYVEALVVKSRLEAEGIEVPFDDLNHERIVHGHAGPAHLYVAQTDEAAARRIIAACQQSSPDGDPEDERGR